MKFVKFREYNDHEGESWNFWLQLEGNEDELGKLSHILSTIEGGGEVWYTLDMSDPLDESEVDILVKHGGSGCIKKNNKVKGKFTCPELDVDAFVDEIPDSAWEFLDNNFYKGDIERHFEV